MLQAGGIGMVVLLGALTALGPLATDIYLASMPAIARHFETTVAEVQWTLSVYLAGFAVAQLIYGPLSDRFGRKPVMLGGLAVFIAASLISALAPSIETLIVARFVQALGVCSGPILGRAVVRDLYSRERASRMLSMMGMVMGLAPILAPIVGSYMQAWFGWRSTFYFVAAYGLTLGLVAWFLLAESNRHKNPSATRPGDIVCNYGTVLRSPTFVAYAAPGVCMMGGLYAFLTGSSFVFIGAFDVDARYFGFLFGLCMLGNISGSAIGGRLVTRVGLDRMLRYGGILALVSGCLIASLAWGGVHSLFAVVVPMMGFLGALSTITPPSMAGALTPFPTMAGTASSLLGFLQSTVGSATGALVGIYYDGTPRSMATAIGVMGVLAFASRLWLMRRRGVQRIGSA
jgi:DHA1 family bicyclomycin/chloramphenicol resistance-like MFS transporter